MIAKTVFESLNEIETIINVKKLKDIVKHLNGEENFAVISAYQKGKTNKQNSENTKKLVKILKSFSNKVIPLIGEWDKNIPEKSYFVLNSKNMHAKDFFKKIKKISNYFNQDSFLYSKKSDILIINKDNSVDDIGDDLNITNSYVGFKFK